MDKGPPPWSAAAQQFKPGRYRHFKGSDYVAIVLARHSETFEELVMYKHADGTRDVWIRPLAMWNEQVDRDGYKGPRFEYVSEM